MQNLGVHLVGSVPLGSAEEVFLATHTRLGTLIKRVPDGETGVRYNFTAWQRTVFDRHPALERSVDPLDGKGGYRLRTGVDPSSLSFGELGYSSAARASWQVFERLQANGDLPGRLRFQVSLPTPVAPIALYFDPSAQAAAEVAYEAAMLRELDEITQFVPSDRLAVQWDTAAEFALLEGVLAPWFPDRLDGILERLVRLAAHVPSPVPYGYHLCYGDSGHQHFVEPKDTAHLVAVANGMARRAARQPSWIHLPVPRGRADAAYFEPLGDLRLDPCTELYLGLVHATDGDTGAAGRIAAARRVVDGFGVATECGFGRRDPATIPALLDLHAAVVAADRGP
jgi:hypothetical protein